MYAIGHTSHTLISLSNSASEKVREKKQKCKKTFKHVFYRTVIKNEIWSFFENYEEAKGFQFFLSLDGTLG